VGDRDREGRRQEIVLLPRDLRAPLAAPPALAAPPLATAPLATAPLATAPLATALFSTGRAGSHARLVELGGGEVDGNHVAHVRASPLGEVAAAPAAEVHQAIGVGRKRGDELALDAIGKELVPK